MRQMLATKRSFVNGSLVEPGFIATVREGLKAGANLTDFDPRAAVGAVTQMAPIGPTGPNPTSPQQIPPDARQTIAGHVLPGGVKLVGEVTLPARERLREINSAGNPAEIAALMDEDGEESGADSVKAIVAELGGKTDDELKQLKASDSRVTLHRAIDAELKRRVKT